MNIQTTNYRVYSSNWYIIKLVEAWDDLFREINFCMSQNWYILLKSLSLIFSSSNSIAFQWFKLLMKVFIISCETFPKKSVTLKQWWSLQIRTNYFRTSMFCLYAAQSQTETLKSKLQTNKLSLLYIKSKYWSLIYFEKCSTDCWENVYSLLSKFAIS